MAAKKVPAKKVPAKKAPAKAGGPDLQGTDRISEKKATAMIKKAFLKEAKRSGPFEIRQNTEGARIRQKGTPAQWAMAVDNLMTEGWFSGPEPSAIGVDRANNILRDNRDKWIMDIYNGPKYPKKTASSAPKKSAKPTSKKKSK